MNLPIASIAVSREVVGTVHRLLHWWRANTRCGKPRNIRAHYDLGNDFFRLWLDETLAYSCGIFRSPGATMHDASVEKFDRVCRKLDLRPTDSVLEIGGGWGGFAIHAAANYGCRVTTTTISQRTVRGSPARIEQDGLRHRISLLERGLPRPERAIRQAGFDRDDRGRGPQEP